MLDSISGITRVWFEQSFPGPTEIQSWGWQTIAAGRHALLVAPTGSGKTLAAFLAGIDGCARLPADSPAGVRVLYVSPLKALVYDVDWEALEEVMEVIERDGIRSFLEDEEMH